MATTPICLLFICFWQKIYSTTFCSAHIVVKIEEKVDFIATPFT